MPIEKLDPDEVVALRFKDEAEALHLAQWCGGEVVPLADLRLERVVDTVLVPTAGGRQRAVVGDWVVRSADGSFAVMSAEDFAARHTPVEG